MRKSIRRSGGTSAFRSAISRCTSDGVTHRIDDAGEFEQQAVAHRFDDAAAIFLYFGVGQLASERLQPCTAPMSRRRGEGAALRERYDRGWTTLIECCFAEYANAAT